MRISSFGRLSNIYRNRLTRLFRGHINEMLAYPEFVTTPKFQSSIWSLAEEMARHVAGANAASWRVLAMKSKGDAKKIYQALLQEIDETGIGGTLQLIAHRNASLIGRLPIEISSQITKKAAEFHLAGKRPEEVAREIRKLAPYLVKTRIDLIARTEISRSETDVTQARAERIGITHYQWETSQDQRVRESHRKMDKVLVPWNDPPSPEALIGEKSSLGRYNAGCCPNCRCIALPLADLSEVSWPTRAYSNGSIVRMTRAQFTRAVGVPMAA